VGGFRRRSTRPSWLIHLVEKAPRSRPSSKQERLFELFIPRFTGNETVRERHRERIVKTLFLECSTPYQTKLFKEFLALAVFHWLPHAKQKKAPLKPWIAPDTWRKRGGRSLSASHKGVLARAH
jgi:hypothetical protein